MGGKKRGFTLVELLVVITIIGVLMALLLPALGAARAAAHRTTCANHLKELAQSISIHVTNKDRFPRLADTIGKPSSTTYFSINWVTDVLKVQRPDVYEKWMVNKAPTPIQIDVLICPSDDQPAGGAGALSYGINAGQPENSSTPYDYKENGIAFTEASGITTTLDYVSKHDGTSLTVLLGENIDATQWTLNTPTPINSEGNQVMWEWNTAITWYPGSSALVIDKNKGLGPIPAVDGNYSRPSSNHSGGVNLAFCDGSVRFVSQTIQPGVYNQLMTPYGAQAKDNQSGSLISQGILSEGALQGVY